MTAPNSSPPRMIIGGGASRRAAGWGTSDPQPAMSAAATRAAAAHRVFVIAVSAPSHRHGVSTTHGVGTEDVEDGLQVDAFVGGGPGVDVPRGYHGVRLTGDQVVQGMVPVRG